ncbi:DNA adenine methylase [Vibrio parahaemolyticus]|nr:DNA adenine methylase [Vibrio parahaemolyticus]EJG0893470.1 DNA adenine methylase [Vibrio parahaemolyticus]EKA7388792.1 DNA adenine methylase [Vibrio parahaemolyticus]ELA9320420.1 DNA adenine methylase [Vibrio parahaemolyticus]
MGYRYIGSKSKILDVVLNKVNDLCETGDTIVDLMCGTATVSKELRCRGYNVISNDLMTYSYHHAVTNLKFSQEPSFSKASKYIKNQLGLSVERTSYDLMLKALSMAEPKKGYFWKEFSSEGKPKNTDRPRNYYSPENAKKIDGIRRELETLKSEGCLEPYEYSLLNHDLIMCTNDIANIAGTYGHYMAKLSGRAKDELKLYKTELLLKDDVDNHTVLQGYAEDNAKLITADLCYIDPPYMKRQYAANYHILETIARGDEPEAMGVSGLRPWRDQYSNFCTKTKIRDSFRKIFQDMNCDRFLISYSEDGLLTVDDFQSLLKPFGDVYIDEFNHKRFKSNNSKLKNNLTEYLILLNKR